MSGSTWTCDMKAITVRPVASSMAAVNGWRIAIWNSWRVLHGFPASIRDERLFGRGVNVFEVDGQEVALVDNACCACSPSVVISVQTCVRFPGSSCLGAVLAVRRAWHVRLDSLFRRCG